MSSHLKLLKHTKPLKKQRIYRRYDNVMQSSHKNCLKPNQHIKGMTPTWNCSGEYFTLREDDSVRSGRVFRRLEWALSSLSSGMFTRLVGRDRIRFPEMFNSWSKSRGSTNLEKQQNGNYIKWSSKHRMHKKIFLLRFMTVNLLFVCQNKIKQNFIINTRSSSVISVMS